LFTEGSALHKKSSFCRETAQRSILFRNVFMHITLQVYVNVFERLTLCFFALIPND